MPPVLSVTPLAARRFLRRALLLDAPVPDIDAVIAHHGYVQIDPINVCGRMHDLILRNRVTGYREGGLMRHLHGETDPLPAAKRTAFEHHHPGAHVLVAFPLDAWPHLLGAMRRRTRTAGAWSGRLTPREHELSTHILGELATRGPLSSDDIDDNRRGRRVWGAATLAKSTLQKLFFHGRVLIAQRDNNRRIYDLPERVLTAKILAQPEPSAADTARWAVLLKLRQRRLTLLKRAELALVADVVQPVSVGAAARFSTASLADVPLPPRRVRRIEIRKIEIRKTAAAPRSARPLDLRPHCQPTALGLRLHLGSLHAATEGRRCAVTTRCPSSPATSSSGCTLDLKADRDAKKLRVVSRSVRRGHIVAPAVRELARFLNLR